MSTSAAAALRQVPASAATHRPRRGLGRLASGIAGALAALRRRSVIELSRSEAAELHALRVRAARVREEARAGVVFGRWG